MGIGSIDAVLDSILDIFMTFGGSAGEGIGGGLGSIADVVGPVLDGLAIGSGGEPAEIGL